MWQLQGARIAPCIAWGHLGASITIWVDPEIIHRVNLHPTSNSQMPPTVIISSASDHFQFCWEGSFFVKPGKGRPEVSLCPLRILKLSVFIHCIHLTMLMHLHVTSGVRNASYSCFSGRGPAFVKPEKGPPEVSWCPLKMLKISVFIHCIIW